MKHLIQTQLFEEFIAERKTLIKEKRIFQLNSDFDRNALRIRETGAPPSSDADMSLSATLSYMKRYAFKFLIESFIFTSFHILFLITLDFILFFLSSGNISFLFVSISRNLTKNVKASLSDFEAPSLDTIKKSVSNLTAGKLNSNDSHNSSKSSAQTSGVPIPKPNNSLSKVKQSADFYSDETPPQRSFMGTAAFTEIGKSDNVDGFGRPINVYKDEDSPSPSPILPPTDGFGRPLLVSPPPQPSGASPIYNSNSIPSNFNGHNNPFVNPLPRQEGEVPRLPPPVPVRTRSKASNTANSPLLDANAVSNSGQMSNFFLYGESTPKKNPFGSPPLVAIPNQADNLQVNTVPQLHQPLLAPISPRINQTPHLVPSSDDFDPFLALSLRPKPGL